MATQLDELVVKLSTDLKDLNQGMAEGTRVIQDSTSKMEKAVQQFSDNSGDKMTSFQRITETALGVFEGEAMLEAIEKLGEKIKEFVTEMISEAVKGAEEHENAITRMNIALASAGQYSKETSKQMQELAESIQKTTAFEGDQVMQAGALIETLGKLDKDALAGATKAAVNLSAALGIDLNTAAMMVGKAAAGHTETFNRYGISIEQGTTSAETFANALKAIAGMGNVAEQQANTYTGALAQLKHAHEDGSKILGEAVVQNQAVIEVMKEVTSMIYEHNDSTKENIQTLKEWVGQGILVAIDALVGFATVLDAAYRTAVVAFEGSRAAAYTMALGISTAIDGPIAAISGLLSLIPGIGDAFVEMRDKAMKNMTDISAEIGKSTDAIGQAMDKPTKAFDMVEGAALRVREAAERGLGAVREGADSTVEPLNQAVATVKELSEEERKLGEEGQKLVKTLEESDPARKYDADLAKLKAANDQKLISDQQYLTAVARAHADFDDKRHQALDKEIDELQKKNQLLYQLDSQANAGEIAANQAKINTLLSQEEAHSLKALQIAEKQKKDKEKIKKAEYDAEVNSLNNLAAFQNSKSAELAAIGKAAAIASATIHTYSAAAAALAPPPIGAGPLLGPILAGTTIAAGLANVAQIAGTPLATGIDAVPGIGSQDNFPAVLAPGERVVPQETNKDLKQFLSMALGKMGGGDQAGPTRVEISIREDFMNFIEAKLVERMRLGISQLRTT